jgi:hypothetical protein
MTDTELTDLRTFAPSLLERRNKAALVLTPDWQAQKSYAAQVAEAIGWPHLDLLDLFQSDPALTERLPIFSLDDLFEWVRSQTSPALVISGIEFLLAAWLSQGNPKEIKADLCNRVELWDRKPAFLLIIHEDPIFANYQPQRHRGSRVILPMSQTLALT